MECWLRLLHSLEEVLKVTNINPVKRTELESHNLETFSSTLPQAMTRICSHSHYTIALVDQLRVDIHIPEWDGGCCIWWFIFKQCHNSSRVRTVCKNLLDCSPQVHMQSVLRQVKCLHGNSLHCSGTQILIQRTRVHSWGLEEMQCRELMGFLVIKLNTKKKTIGRIQSKPSFLLLVQIVHRINLMAWIHYFVVWNLIFGSVL